MLFLPGDTVDRYVIEALVGEGGMGRVYRAHDPRLRRTVALKVLRLDHGGDSGGSPSSPHEAARRMMREARAAAALNHANAVSVFDVGEVGEALYIAMEFVAGKTLRAYVGNPDVSWDVKLRWLVDAARALGAAHERGLVHRDVKPENVMVREDGVIKVLDFGVVKQIAADTGGAKSDATANAILGTPRYLSPEQLQGSPLDGRADQFSWAVMAYELLSGALPWKGQLTGLRLLMAILKQDVAPLSQVVPGIPSGVEATIARALAKAAADRFASMADVVSSLESFVTSRQRSLHEIHPMATRRTDPAPPHVTPISASTTRPDARATAARQLRRLALVALFVVLCTGFGALVVVVVTGKGNGGEAHVVASVSLLPTALTDLPMPSSQDAAARAAFQAFAQSFRDGAFDAAKDALERATAVDPGFAAAHLRLAFMQSLVAQDEAEVRRSFKKAVQYRTVLDARDQILLDALEPYLQREPSDLPLCVKRLEDAMVLYPGDAELAYYTGSVRYDLGRLAAAVDAFDQGIAIDPKFAQAYAARGGALAYLGKIPDALASLDRCLAISTSATECMWNRILVDEQEGLCADMEAEARRWISRDSDDYFAYQCLAKALFAEGKALDTVRAALEQKWVRAPAVRRSRMQLLDRARLHVVAGEFAEAEQRALELEKEVVGEPGAMAHAESHRLLVAIYTEEGRVEDARRVAAAYLERKDAWVAPHRVDDGAMAADAVPEMLAALARAGAMSAERFEEARGAWLRVWRAKTSEGYARYLWIHGYAAPTTTPEDARRALAALPGFEPLPPYTPQTLAPAHIGRVFALAGDAARAIPALQRAARSCVALDDPLTHTRAMAQLGRALEAAGDTSGACAAYRVVMDRWGAAKPASVTRESVKPRLLALGCGRDAGR